jgi:hypothetical protein
LQSNLLKYKLGKHVSETSTLQIALSMSGLIVNRYLRLKLNMMGILANKTVEDAETEV